MTVLITGANGQVGWELARQAKEKNIPHVGLNRNQLDITSKDQVQTVINTIKPDLVINAAAYTAVDKAETEKDLAFAVNQLGPRYLAQACSKLDIPIIHLSTDYVFDGTKGTPYTPEDKPNPINVYGESKLAGEQEVQKYCDKYIIFRTSWVFGIHGSNFVKTMIRFAADGHSPKVVSDQKGSPTSAKSIANVLLPTIDRIGAKKWECFGIQNLAGCPVTSWYELALKIFDFAKRLGASSDLEVYPVLSKDYPSEASRPKYTALEINPLFKKFLNVHTEWEPEINRTVEQLFRL